MDGKWLFSSSDRFNRAHPSADFCYSVRLSKKSLLTRSALLNLSELENRHVSIYWQIKLRGETLSVIHIPIWNPPKIPVWMLLAQSDPWALQKRVEKDCPLWQSPGWETIGQFPSGEPALQFEFLLPLPSTPHNCHMYLLRGKVKNNFLDIFHIRYVHDMNPWKGWYIERSELDD